MRIGVTRSAIDTMPLSSSLPSSLPLYRRLLAQAMRHRLVFMLALLAVAIDAAGQGLFIYLLRPLIDETLVATEPSLSWTLPLLVLAAIVLRVLGNFGGVFGMDWVGRRLIADLREALFTRYLLLSSRYFDQHSSGQMISRLTYNVEQVAQAATTALIGAARDVLTVVALVGVMLIQSWRLTLTMLILAPAIAVVVTLISRRFRILSTRIQDSMGDVTHRTEQAVGGHEVIKVYGGTEQERRAFHQGNETNRRLNLRLTLTQLVSSSLIQLAAGLAVIVLLMMATTQFLAAEVSAGIFMSVLAAMVACIPPLKRLTKVHAVIEKGLAAADSIYEVLDTEVEPDTGHHDPVRSVGHIVLDGVSFAYQADEPATLNNINLEMKPGSVTALVGRSGSGKSTLARLLPRFYAPSDGVITLDGVDLGAFSLSALRRQIALVSQDVVLFNDTVAANIAYGQLSSHSMAAIEAAARDANALEFIEALPQGFDTVLGAGGATLSGGQRQRLAIARALLKDAPILILDEATAALDAESEQAIQTALERLMARRTTLVIAHRLATVKRADQVVVLDHGRVIECGSHEQLLAAGDGVYAHLYRLQFQDTMPP